MDFHFLNIHRPLSELSERLEEACPSGLITEWLPEITDRLLDLGLPTVIADTDMEYPSAVSVDVDDYAVGHEAASYFIGAGYRHFACLGNMLPYSEQRMDGFLQKLREEGFTADVHVMEEAYEKDHLEPVDEHDASLRWWLMGLPKPVAIFAVHDPLGRFLCETCRSLALVIPDQVSVIGANNDPLVCGLSYPALASVHIPWDQIGDLVAKAMMGMLSGEEPSKQVMKVQPGAVHERHSAGRVYVEDPDLSKVLAYMEAHHREPITIYGLCDKLRLTRRTIERKFSEYFRCSPWQMLCQFRVETAKKLLMSSGHSVALVSELSGFNDPERMAVVFRRVTGRPPSSFR